MGDTRPARSASTQRRRSWSHRQSTPLAHALGAIGDRWSLLIVLALGTETVRLTRLQERLPGISAGVLNHHVQDLVAQGVLSRRRFREVPPRVEVALTESGRELLPIAAALGRWGMRQPWFSPGETHSDITALLRTLPALLETAEGLSDGRVEMVVESSREHRRHVFVIRKGHVNVAGGSVQNRSVAADACIAGDERAWVAALGPERDARDLRFEGSARLAKQMLDALPTSTSTPAPGAVIAPDG